MGWNTHCIKILSFTSSAPSLMIQGTCWRSWHLPQRERDTHLAQESESARGDVVGAGVTASLATAPWQPGEPTDQQWAAWAASAGLSPALCRFPNLLQISPLAGTTLKVHRKGNSGKHSFSLAELTHPLCVSLAYTWFNYTNFLNEYNWKTMFQPNIMHLSLVQLKTHPLSESEYAFFLFIFE